MKNDAPNRTRSDGEGAYGAARLKPQEASATMSRVVRGTVKTWYAEEGWGVLVSPDVAGEVFAHVSHIQADGYRDLQEGAKVDFEYEPFPEGQDEDDGVVYYFRATRVIER